MFPITYYADSYFPTRYFPKVGYPVKVKEIYEVITYLLRSLSSLKTSL